MIPDKLLKKEFKKETSSNPDTYYPTVILKKEGFMRKHCSCGLYFWTVNKNQEKCGDPSCNGGTSLTKNNPAKNKLTYVNVWKKIVEVLEPRGYKPIDRYPVAARWNPTTDFVMASIAAFQPYVVSGEVEPPAKKLIIPQFCLRFGDVDNVGVTGSHMTGFVMIGQHMFVGKDEWDQEQAFKDIYDFLITGVGLAKEEVTIHEDAWAGGGNFGPCMEFFSRGVELFNQVYMMFEQTESGRKALDIKVLDMGLGMERIAWFSQGKKNIYEATFPEVINRLIELTGVEMDQELFARFSQYSALLNADEVESMDEAWKNVASKLDVSVEELRNKIEPMTAIFSIAEHARTLLVAISDGALPSNVGGGYNLRLVFRRAMRFIDAHEWKIDMGEIAELHAIYLRELFPELEEHVLNVKKVLSVEKEKYYDMKRRSRQIVEQAIRKEIDTERLIELYDSQGINPDIVKEEAAKLGKVIDIPDNFFALVAERHEKKEIDTATVKEKEIELGIIKETEALYFGDWKYTEFKATVLKIVGENVVLDKSAFYPTSGGQLHDMGTINGCNVVDVFKQGKVIVHVVKNISFKEGDTIDGSIDFDRRKQLAEHHTSTHIVNAAAKNILGDHINQAGARKTLEKATLDVTHYQSISDEELSAIEEEANRIVDEHIEIKKMFLSREQAEKLYGMRIYQGGAVPGKVLRIVDIPEVDVEACGGTHLNNTSEAGKIRLLKSSKIQDGIVRITFTAGKRSESIVEESGNVLIDAAKLLNVNPDQVPGRATELFLKWKKAKKSSKPGELTQDNFDLFSVEAYDGDSLLKTAEILRTQKEHVVSTLKRFLKELEEMKNK